MRIKYLHALELLMSLERCPSSTNICNHSLDEKAINKLLRKAKESHRVPSLNAPMLIKTLMQIWKQLKIRLCLSITATK